MQKTVYGRRSVCLRLRYPDQLLLWKRALTTKQSPSTSRTLLLAMKLTIVFLTAAFLQVHANAVSQSVTISGKNLSLKKVFSIIEQQTGFVVLSNKKDLEATKPVTLAVFDMPLQHLLNMVLKDQPVNFRLDGTTIVLSRKPQTNPLSQLNVYRAGVPVDGGVVDSAGKPIQGASVRLLPIDKGTTTNQFGSFSISNVPAGNYTLEVSFVGYDVHRQKITVPQYGVMQLGKIVLNRTNASMDVVEVVVTGYQTLPRDRATGSFSTVNHELLSTRVEPSLMTRLEGLVPGLFSRNGDFNIRGLATLYGERRPLIVVDGYPYEGDINYLNPDDILNVTVLKDAAAASIYGTRSANGVIVITTRLGSARQTRINFNSTVFITPKPDVSYLQLMNSSEVVDLQRDLFNKFHEMEPNGLAVPKVTEAMYRFERGDITQAQLDAILNELRSRNGKSQIDDMLMQSIVSHKHSLSVTGGNEKNQYSINLNYIGNRSYTINTNSEAINLSLNDKAQVFKWLTAEAGIFANFSKNKYADINATQYYSWMPYEILKDDAGNYVPWNYLKSPTEIERLNNLGLLDESWNPLQDMSHYDIRSNSQYVRVQGGFNVKFTKFLNLDVKYQTERGSSYSKNYQSFESWRTANVINDATQITNGEIVKNIPDGGQVWETRGDSRSYTARAQLNFDKRFGTDHQLTAIAGSERRSVLSNSTTLHRFGYNDQNLQFQPVNYDTLADLKGTQAIGGAYRYIFLNHNNFRSTEERYVSFYGNAGYTYKGRYNLTGSLRVDDSNLWGTDPKYRHLPLWSAGASWRISSEDFMNNLFWLSNLNLRATYGKGGNTARETGPYLIVNSGYYNETDAIGTNIVSPPNKSLRWEKTATTNFGLDFAILKNRISGSFDYYIRKTTDLLGEKPTDPTNAFNSALINYGSVTNKGFEIALNTVNIDRKDVNWSSRISFTKNKNRMTEIAPRSNLLVEYLQGYGTQMKGYAMNSIFNFRSAGLDPTNGTPMVYDKDGKVVTNYDQNGNIVTKMTEFAGLVHGGTLDPTYTVGFMNTVRYKRFTLTMMIIANGGNVIRDAIPGILTSAAFDRNIDRRALNYWKKPGDEKLPGVQPAPALRNSTDYYLQYLWFATDANTMKADYIKVRNIGLSYDFASHLSKLTKLNGANLLVQVQNPFSWFRNDKDLDPEAYLIATNGATRNLPVMPVYMIGLNVTF
jgi:TonB-linked SusC/RagA family outer membrane protein